MEGSKEKCAAPCQQPASLSTGSIENLDQMIKPFGGFFDVVFIAQNANSARLLHFLEQAGVFLDVCQTSGQQTIQTLLLELFRHAGQMLNFGDRPLAIR